MTNKFLNDTGLTTLWTKVDDKFVRKDAFNTALSGKSDVGHTHDYLPLSGGTLTGPIEIKSSVNNEYNEGLRITCASNEWAGITFGSTGLKGAPTDGWFVALNPQDQFIISPNDSQNSTGLTLNEGGDAKWRNNVIIHLGNINDYAGRFVYQGTYDLNEIRGGFRAGKLFGASNAANDYASYRGFLEYGASGYVAQFNSDNANNLFYRWCEDGIWKPWRTIAFTDSNVASATSASLLNTISGSTTSTSASVWNPLTSYTKIWGQTFINSNLSSDSGDLVYYLRRSEYATKQTELCMCIDGDYYACANSSGPHKVWHDGNLTKVSQLTNDSGYLTSMPTHTHTILGNCTLTGTLTIKRSASVLEYQTAGGERLGYLGFRDANVPCVYENDGTTYHVLSTSEHTHSYLPLSGGTLTNTLNITLNNNNVPFHIYHNSDNWSCTRLGSDSMFWDIATSNSDSNSSFIKNALEFRPLGHKDGCVAIRLDSSGYGKLTIHNDKSTETSIGYYNSYYSDDINKPAWVVGSGISSVSNFDWWEPTGSVRMTLKPSGELRLKSALHITPSGSSYSFNENIRLHPSSDGWHAIVMCGPENTGDSGVDDDTWGIYVSPSHNFFINRQNSNIHTTYELCNVDGNWGISTVLPSAKLHVNGSFKAGSTNLTCAGCPQLVCNSTSGSEANIRFDMSDVVKGYCGYITTHGTFLFNAKSQKYLAINDSGVAHVSGTAISLNGHSHNAATTSVAGFVSTEAQSFAGAKTFTSTVTATGFYENSDERLKDFEDDIDIDLNALKKIPKKYFKFKEDPSTTHIGTSAQVIKELYPELVTENEEGYLSVDYAKLSIIALKAIDELYEDNKNIKDRLNKIETLLNIQNL